ncbi:hypothetical protein EDD11_006396 [Mortierella claussenii]|nr:hypothetical protein EDD11_006396 [Mortierella claussenii]
MPHIPIPIGVMPLVNANANAHINAVAVAAAAAAAATAANGNIAVPIDALTDAAAVAVAPIPGLQAPVMLALDADTEMTYLDDEHSDAAPIPFTPFSYILHPMVIEIMDIDPEVGQDGQLEDPFDEMDQ